MLFILLGVGEYNKNLAKNEFTQLEYCSFPSPYQARHGCHPSHLEHRLQKPSVMQNIPWKSQFLPHVMTNGASCDSIAWYSWSIEPSSVAFLFSGYCPPTSWWKKPCLWKDFTGNQNAGSSWRWWREQGTTSPVLHRHSDLHLTELQVKQL